MEQMVQVQHNSIILKESLLTQMIIFLLQTITIIEYKCGMKVLHMVQLLREMVSKEIKYIIDRLKFYYTEMLEENFQ